VEITFLFYEDCPSHDEALKRLKEVMEREGLQVPVDVIKVETEKQAKALRFLGSPTILVNGQDICPQPHETHYGLTCRAYRLEDGRISPLPSEKMIHNALRYQKSSEAAP
jgi:hypothetical protein